MITTTTTDHTGDPRDYCNTGDTFIITDSGTGTNSGTYKIQHGIPLGNSISIPGNISIWQNNILSEFPYKVGDALLYHWGERYKKNIEIICEVLKVGDNHVIVEFKYPEEFAQIKRIERDNWTKLFPITPVEIAKIRMRLESE